MIYNFGQLYLNDSIIFYPQYDRWFSFSDLKIPSVVPRATEKRPSKDTIEVVPLDIHYYHLVMTNIAMENHHV